jgi:pimeloyl-ACP methyl ester carboxylesterase
MWEFAQEISASPDNLYLQRIEVDELGPPAQALAELKARLKATCVKIGGSGQGAPEKLSPAELLPLRVPQLLIHREADKNVPLVNAQGYTQVAKDRGDHVDLAVIPEAAHFELMAPRAAAWDKIQSPLLAFLTSIQSGEGVR